MCPYYNEDYKKCIIYKTYPSDYTRKTFCMECDKPYKECANYKESKRVNGGEVPPPYKYK